ncbi:putative NBD/HSP70 family sugar kinase [Paenibacillus sp. V4I3]|uniref:ROK family protein n=1 Tax=Paenibacillus sp. V4I3 TaxID=3042305 RepID=UPI00278A1D8D|nr:ROK family protein [Paenibacillus sp. V4I3]MDQ0871386.1 putative NBD/HSP70 family sugar kinase [Paenibacillus sp. V4I3]
MKGSEIPADHPAWAVQAFYIGQAVTTAILMLSPKKVTLGGGVMQQKQLLPMIRTEVQRNLNGYVSAEAILTNIAPGLGDNAGLCGALALGLKALKTSNE